MNSKIFLFSVLVSLLFTACREGIGVGDGNIASLLLDEYTPEHNLLIGNAVDAEARLLYPTLSSDENPEAMQYLQEMLNLVITTPNFTNRTFYNWQISIIPDDNKTTSFALPNGHLYIYSGLLKYLESESQLINLLTHELAYVEEGMVAALLMEREFGKTELGDITLNNGLADTKAMAQVFPSLMYENEDVLIADEFSVEVLCPFVYEPRGVVKIIEKSLEFPGERLEWLDMRPADDKEERINRINVMADECGLDGVKNEEEYQAFLMTF